MSLAAMSAVFKLSSDIKLSPANRLILLALADNCNEDGFCWPGMKYLTKKTGIKRRWIQRNLKIMAEMNPPLVIITPNYREDGGQASNDYQLLLDNLTTTPGGMVCRPQGDGLQAAGGDGLQAAPINPHIESSGNPKEVLPPTPSLKNLHLEFVRLSPEEYKKLVERFGRQETEAYIERLNNYIGSKGKKYKSHYHTILNWSQKDHDGEKQSTVQPPPVVRDAEGFTPADRARERIEKLRKAHDDDKT